LSELVTSFFILDFLDMDREKEIRHLEASKKTRHHLISQCQRELFNVGNPKNITKIRRDTHQAIHTLFRDEHWPINEPKEQLRKIFELMSPVFSDRVCRQLERIVNMDDRDFYQSDLIKWKK